MNLPGIFSTKTTGGSFQDDRLNVMFRIWLFEFVSYFGFSIIHLPYYSGFVVPCFIY